MLKAEKLNKYYRRFGQKPLHVVDNTTLEIPETGIIAVVGASGAGKTTLVNVVSGLDSYKSGTISFDGETMSHYSNHIADKLRLKNYGFIFQNYYLLEKATVYENVKIALDAFDMSESEKKKRVNYVLNQLGIARYTNKLVTSLSGGEQQRVSIARALVKSPKIIFADEPTGSLDEKTTFTVFNILKKISKTCAVFIVTHEKDIISYYADYILELDNGVVIKEFVPTRPEKKSLAVDQNIYLSELNKIDSKTVEDVNISIYSDNKSSTPADVKIAIRNNKIYLEASSNIVVLNEQSENHILEGKKREIEDYVDEDFDFHLEPLKYTNNKMKFTEILKKGYQNFKRKRSIKNILKAVCVVFSASLMVLLEGINTIQSADLSEDLSTSQGNLYVEVVPDGDSVVTSHLTYGYQEVANAIDNSDLPGEILFLARDTLYFTYEGFYQIQHEKYRIPFHDFKTMNNFDESTLIFGHLPTNPREVIVDEYVLENLKNSTLLENAITDYGYFVGKTLTSNYYKYELTISGVCRTKNPTIYGHQTVNYLRLSNTAQLNVIDLDYAKTVYPDLLGNINIAPGHCLRKETYTSGYFDYLEIDSMYGDEIAYDVIINPVDYQAIRLNAISKANYFYISTNIKNGDFREYIKLIEEVNQHIREVKHYEIKINAEEKYKEEYDKAVADLNSILSVTQLVALIVGGIAILLIIISTYFSMLSQIADIAVYRSLGYSRVFLGLTYFVELALISLIYCTLGGALSYFVMFILDVIPLVAFSLATPIIQLLILVFGLSAIITIIGIIPVMLVFGLTPAKIYSKYNKRINNA